VALDNIFECSWHYLLYCTIMEQSNLSSSSSVYGTETSHSPLPLAVVKGRKSLLCIPDDFRSHIPPSTMSIDELISSVSFPPSLDTPIPASTANVFSSMPPILDYSVVKSLPLPPLVYTNHVLNAFDDAWSTGKQSIMHPSDGTVHLPVWVLVYWKKLWNALDAKHKWTVVKDWLHTLSHEDHPMSKLAHEALHSFIHLGWNTSMHGAAIYLQTLDFVHFLSTNLINGSIVDAMMYHLAQRVKLNPTLQDDVYVGDLAISHTLRLDLVQWGAYNSDAAFTRLCDLGSQL
jgi:hypothetical protein